MPTTDEWDDGYDLMGREELLYRCRDWRTVANDNSRRILELEAELDRLRETHPREQIVRDDPALRASLERGMADSAAGRLSSLGRFSGEPHPELSVTDLEPDQPCGLGLPSEHLRQVLSAGQFKSLNAYLVGQTIGICDGRRYNHDTEEYEPTGCGPHGTVVYRRDVQRWIDGLPVDD